MSLLKITEVFREIVNQVNTDITATIRANETAALGRASLITGVHYEHGHILEIIETLRQKDASPAERFNKYPVICLLEDIREFRGRVVGTYGSTPSLNIVIVHHSRPEYKAEDRKQKVFYPVLYPVYEALLEAIADHPLVVQHMPEVENHTKTDRLYWGRELAGINDKNIFEDWVDATEINNLNLSFYKPC